MKPGRTQSQRLPGAGKSPPKEGTPLPIERMPAPRSRRWLFRALALVSPILVLGLGELGLRLAGYGYATSFFLERPHEGRALLIENPKFGWRFFPPSLARSPQPLSLAAAKTPGTIRIFVLGESAAMGDPEPAYGLARQLERLLQARRPERKLTESRTRARGSAPTRVRSTAE